MKHCAFFFVLLAAIAGCGKDDPIQKTPDESMYFPAGTNAGWETKTPASLGWNASAVQPLRDYLTQSNTKSFMILVNGRIVMEEYFGGHTPTATWQWNSAGKTLVTATVGIARQDGLLDINGRVSQYLGAGWTSEPADKENLITPRHLLTMTSGLNDATERVTKPNLTYLADAGARWSYHNVFQKLMDVVAVAGGQDFETYFDARLKSKTGMDGYWNNGPVFRIYHSSTRGMARFGLLALNKGRWKNEQILNEAFFDESVSSSQSMNPAYGYLWWLNGKATHMVPGSQTVYQGPLVSNAPPDMYAAMGAGDQRIYVVPGKNMVVVRMGNPSDLANPNFAVSGFDNALWQRINAVVN